MGDESSASAIHDETPLQPLPPVTAQPQHLLRLSRDQRERFARPRRSMSCAPKSLAEFLGLTKGVQIN